MIQRAVGGSIYTSYLLFSIIFFSLLYLVTQKGTMEIRVKFHKFQRNVTKAATEENPGKSNL